jgi:hypothetical protein
MLEGMHFTERLFRNQLTPLVLAFAKLKEQPFGHVVSRGMNRPGFSGQLVIGLHAEASPIVHRKAVTATYSCDRRVGRRRYHSQLEDPTLHKSTSASWALDVAQHVNTTL